ncbi:MAG: EAL domain-containing protein [Steroidobacteraceae bacterium]
MSTEPPIRLLFIEDVSTEVELAVRQFSQRGIACEWRRVDTEPQLREQLASFAPDVVLSDFTMPRLDGWTGLACVKAHDPDLPFLFLSGTIGEEGAIEALRHGAMDYVLKHNIERLVPAVQRAQREARLVREQRRAAQQLRDIVESSQDWIWELNLDRQIVFTSPSVETILGHSVDEVGRTDILEHIASNYRDNVKRDICALASHRRSARFLVPFPGKDGHHRWLETNVLALFDAGSRIVGFRGSSRDVTEREEQQHRLARMERVLKMVSGINGALVRLRDRDPLLNEACRIAVNVGGYKSAAISVLEPGQLLQIIAVAGPYGLPVGTLVSLSASDSLPLTVTARAIRTKEPVVAQNRPNSEMSPGSRSPESDSTPKATVAIPLIVDHTVVGAITLCTAVEGQLDQRELQLLQEVAANVSFALQYLARQTTVHFLSYFDQLTGLAMRKLFCERIEQQLARRLGPEVRPAIIVLDLERLGLVNESAGRHVGDGLLQRVADRLRRNVDGTECLAHLGSGAFALSMPLLGSPEHAFALLHERIFRLFAKAFEIDGHTIRVGVRCGIASFPEDGQGAVALLENAEAALKSAKESGESFLPYKMQMHRGKDQRLALEQRLRVAIEEQQFVLHYQPKVDIGSGRLVGLEALVRWNEPGRGLVAPAEFLPVLESTQLIAEVGDWVMQQAIADLRRWASIGLHVRVAVNVSPWELGRRKFADRVLAHLGSVSNHGASGLDVEITESAILQNPDDATTKLSILRSAGVSVALDDFGTGYSSLSRLSLLPVDTLKIDRSFVAGLPTQDAAVALVSTVIALARAFSLNTVAEGVETTEQLQSLQALGCQQSQGYLHGRPQPLSEITDLLQKRRASEIARSTAGDLSAQSQRDARKRAHEPGAQ